MDRVVTIPKNLQEKRDEMALQGFNEQDLLLMSIDKMGTEEDSDGHKYAADFRIGFRYGYPRGVKIGFDAACALLLPEIEKIINRNSICPSDLKSWQRFTEGGE